MDERNTQLTSLRRRRNLGVALLFAGVIPMIALMIFIVAIGNPEPWVLFATVGCWMVFFLGKTLMKTATITTAEMNQEDPAG